MICVLMSISLWAQVAVLDILQILDCLGQVNADYLQVLYLGRAPRTKETLPDFLKWRRVTRHPLVFRGLTGSQRTPRVWGVTETIEKKKFKFNKLIIYIYSNSFYLFFYVLEPMMAPPLQNNIIFVFFENCSYYLNLVLYVFFYIFHNKKIKYFLGVFLIFFIL